MRIDFLTFWGATCSLAAFSMVAGASVGARAAEPLKVLIIDGENSYHDWQKTTPALRKILEGSGRFTVDVATVPPADKDDGTFRIGFKNYDAVLSNYNSQRLPREQWRQDFLDYVRGGGGFVCFHAADNSFAHWPEYNEVTGLGGWYERDKTWGPYVYYKDDKLIRDETSDGPCGHHGPRHQYLVRVRDADHPITRGLPAEWMHVEDELYDSLRGPAKNMTVLATAYSEKKYQGTERDEPMLLVLSYGDGRVFHTIMGHDEKAMSCVGFQTTLLRGIEWAATGEVTIEAPQDFPTAETVSVRE